MSEGSRKSKHRRLMRYTQKYERKDGTTVLMDSSWEIALAKRLDKINVEWIRPEPLPWIDNNKKSHNYFPDFYLPVQDIYLDPKNPAAYINQIEKMNIVLVKYQNIKILKTLEECVNFLP